MKVLEWSQCYSNCKSMGIYSRCLRAALSVVGGGVWPKFKLIQAFIVALVKMKALEWSQCFSRCKSMVIFPDAQGQLTL